ncbi:unnamed protein product [Mytilus edulis]|uniref:Uncharacterized protein n=1 Tax=Mytilus edulis TaxID=6550 RepID=A0A8S3RUZ3_MYTED|nr:unnamed protein product [Mytilus edulis]
MYNRGINETKYGTRGSYNRNRSEDVAQNFESFVHDCEDMLSITLIIETLMKQNMVEEAVTIGTEVWLECNGSEKNILKAIPNTCPFFMPMNDDQIDVDRLKSDINKVNKQNGCAKDGWWTSFFTDIESMYFTTSTCKRGTDGDCKAVKLYPSELHGRDCENVFTPTFVGVLQLRTDPAMNKGTAGATALIVLQYMDLPRTFVIDWLHAVLLGVVKTILTLWCDPVYKGNTYYIAITAAEHRQEIKKAVTVSKKKFEEVMKDERNDVTNFLSSGKSFNQYHRDRMTRCFESKAPGIVIQNFEWMDIEAEKEGINESGKRDGFLIDEMSIQDDIQIVNKHIVLTPVSKTRKTLVQKV